jgi:hypothetical protein
MRAAENDEISLESKSQTDRETLHDWRLLGWRRDCLDISVLGIGHGGLAGDSNVTPVIGGSCNPSPDKSRRTQRTSLEGRERPSIRRFRVNYRQHGNNRLRGTKLPVCRPPCKSVVKRRRRCSGRARESAQCTVSGFIGRMYASRHWFLLSAEPDIHLLSQAPWSRHRRLSLCSLPVPKQFEETPREIDLLRSVG